MKYRFAGLALFLAALPSAVRPASDDSIRGFDAESQAEEIKWEREARAMPEAAHIGEFIRHYADRPHLAGTPQSKQTAEDILAQLKEIGLDAHMELYEAMLPQPKARVLEISGPAKSRLKLEEPVLSVDKNSADPNMVMSYNAYSGDGDVTAPLIYVNYGLPEDYATLARFGIDVKGKLVVARYGRSFRGTKAKVAQEHGAAGCIIYSDPRDDGYYQGDVYPKGAWRPGDGVQRGSLLDLTTYPGDPLSPGWASEPGSKRLSPEEAPTVMKIPVMPISSNDARLLLERLEGPVAPEAWRGALPLTYHLGPGASKVHLKVQMDNATRPLYDVIAVIPGSEFPDQWVLDGNHHDAWVHGASDPLSGTSTLMETARTLAAMGRRGWKPRRTIVFAFWDGEEFGLIGSTEYMEKHAVELDRKLVSYLNADSNGKGAFVASGSHSLEQFVEEIVRDVKEPASVKTLLESRANPNTEFRMAPMGSGSDYTPFIQHLGVASMDLRFASPDSGVYHSIYDDYAWYSRFGDPGFLYGKTLSQVHITAVMRMADAPLLPFEFGRLGSTVGRYVDEIEKLSDPAQPVDLDGVRAATARLKQASSRLEATWSTAVAKAASASPEKLEAVNERLYRTERKLTADPGLPGRPWYRHRLYAPGRYTGYEAKTLPGVREAMESKNIVEARREAETLTQVLRAFSDELDQIQRMLGEL